MPRTTTTKTKYSTVQYSTRHLRLDLLDRMRIIAMNERCSVEDILNKALAIGVTMIEQDGGKRARR